MDILSFFFHLSQISATKKRRCKRLTRKERERRAHDRTKFLRKRRRELGD